MRFRWILLLIIFVVISISGSGQNLVPNPSFEDTVPCSIWTNTPPGPVTDWFTPTISSPDWFSIGTLCGSSAPVNISGFQFARTGISYTGLIAFPPWFAPSNTREYLTCQLTQSLQQNKKYCVGFYVSLADTMLFSTDGMGAYISIDTPTCAGNFCLLPYSPQILNPIGNVLSDKANWTLISGIFSSIGGEKFITIGNFTPDSLNLLDSLTMGNYPAAYYYIDDVFVEEMIYDTANAGGDKDICEGDSVQLGIAVCDGCIYAWQPAAGLSDSTMAQPLVFPTQSTTYILTVRDTTTGTLCDWTSTDTVIVFVEPPCPKELEVYNIFTPNGDTHNDVFYIKNLPANSALQIFNRWGSKVYSSSNYNNTWDGNDVPDGTYFYLLTLPTKEVMRGFVEVRR